MSASRIKNLILLILLLAVCFLLLAVVPGKLSAQRAEHSIHEQLETLFASYGVTLDPEILGRSETLYTIELSEPDEQAAAEALLGSEAQADAASTRYESRYTAPDGSVSFSRSGQLDAALESQMSGRSPEADLKRRLRGMGCTVWQKQPGVRTEDGAYSLTVTQSLLGMPVFGAELTFTYRSGLLTQVSGLFYPDNGTISRISEQSCISCADALTQILASRDETGWVGSRIVSVRQGYQYAETATAALRFVPVWRIETDTATFYVNGITREVRQLNETRLER